MKKVSEFSALGRIFELLTVALFVLTVPAISVGQDNIDLIERQIRRLESKVYTLLEHVEQIDLLNRDLEERVQELERKLEGEGERPLTWICKIETTFKTYSAVASSRALAEEKVIRKCVKDTLESNSRGAICSH